MGKKLDAFLGRSFKTSKFKAHASLAVSRLAVFKNQRQVKCSHARSDVVQFLEQGHHERALLRVEQVIKEQNMLDAYVMMEGHFNLLMERVHLLEQEKECPEELEEAISTLLFASSRCGDFPELQEIRAVFTSRYGKQFAGRAIELRNNCRVNHRMIVKLSTRQPNLENRMKVLKEIAAENNIVLKLEEDEEDSSVSTKENMESNKKQNHPEPEKPTNSDSTGIIDSDRKEGLPDSMRARKYADVADAAQAAFESAAHAAAAARVAVELSRTYPHDPGNHNNPNNRKRESAEFHTSMELEPGSKNHEMHEHKEAKFKAKRIAEEKRSVSASISDSDSAEYDLKVTAMSSDAEEDPVKQLEKDTVFDDSEDETSGLGFNAVSSENQGTVLPTDKSYKQIPLNLQTGLKEYPNHEYSTVHATQGTESSQQLNLEKGPISVRTRRVRGF